MITRSGSGCGRTAAASAVAVSLALALAGCTTGTGSAFGYGNGQNGGSISSAPIDQGEHVVIGVPLDNSASEAIQMNAVSAEGASNLTFGRVFVAPVLKESDDTWLAFSSNALSDDPTLLKEWALREPVDGYRVAAKQKNLQALIEVTVRDESRSARVTGFVLHYTQGGRAVTETTHEEFCYFTKHRASVCKLP